MEPGTFFLIILLVVIAWVIFIYNHLVQLRENVKNGWLQIDVQLKRRHDLLPHLTEVAGTHLHQHQSIFANAARAGQIAGEAKSLKDIQDSENNLTTALANLFAAADNDLSCKSDPKLARLREDLVSTEKKIAFARQYYNDEVHRLNVALQMFPNHFIAKFFHFGSRPSFELKD